MSSRLSGKSVVMIIAQEFEDIELLYPILRLSEEGAAVMVVPVASGFHPRPSIDGKPVTGRFGHPVPIPVMPPGSRYTIHKLDEVQNGNPDCLLFPGGFSPDYLRRDDQVLELVRQHHRNRKLLAAICHAPWIFISAGIMKGRRATGLRAVKDDLINAGANYLDVPVVCDGNIITSRMPNDLPDFCGEIIKALSLPAE